VLTPRQAVTVQTGVLVIRVWREPEETAFRGRITACIDIVRSGNEVVTVGTAGEAEQFVSSWLGRFAHSPRAAAGSGHGVARGQNRDELNHLD
jgi:hypothetical protein